MPDIIGSFEIAQQALNEVVIQTNEPGLEGRAHFLSSEVGHQIDIFKGLDIPFSGANVSHLGNLAQAMVEALGNQQLRRVVDLGASLLGALPGEIQGDMDPPKPSVTHISALPGRRQGSSDEGGSEQGSAVE